MKLNEWNNLISTLEEAEIGDDMTIKELEHIEYILSITSDYVKEKKESIILELEEQDDNSCPECGAPECNTKRCTA